jgi:hypothetical protein
MRDFQEVYGDDEPEETGESDGEEGSTEEPKADAAAAEPEQKPADDTPLAESDDGDDDTFRIPDDQFKALPSGVKQRLGHLNTRAKKAERELSEQTGKMAPMRESHDRFTKLQSFVQQNDIEPANVTLAFNAMAAMSKGDYQGFVDLVQPWFTQANHALGASFSPDLQQRVDDGYLTDEDARELTKSRTQNQINQGRLDRMGEQQTLQTQQTQTAQSHASIAQAITSREEHFKSSDPDYAQKSQAMRSMVEFALKSGAAPRTAQEATQLLDNAYERVNASYVKPAPPRPTPPRPSASSPPRGSSAPENTHDAIGQALRNMPNA